MDNSQGNNNRLPSNLPQLQNLIKRDSVSYAEEFERQYSVYAATLIIFEQNPTVYNEHLHELVMFMAQVAQCYPKQLNEYPQELVTILKRHASVLHPEMRMSLVKALVLLRNKNLLSPTDLHILFFQLLRCQDKALRKFLQQHIVTDIKNLNSKSKNMKLNRELQNFMYEMLKAKHAVAAKTSLNVMIDLYNKKIWNDAKTINIITTACFHKVTKIMVAAVKFFVGKDDDEPNKSDSDSDSEDEQAALKATVMAYRVNKKTKKRKQKKVEKVKSIVKKTAKNKNTKTNIDFSALHLIHDPQDMAERLYKKLEGMNERFEVKLMTMNLISRLIGIHKLYLPNYYAMLQRYLFPHQREVTKVMVFAAQAAHDEMPPDELEPVVRSLANNFVTERYSNEVMAMGLNAIRELCARNPYSMSEELLQDLVMYRTHKDKGVSMAARSLLVLYRDKNPMFLVRKDRGAPTELKAEGKQQMFGEHQAKGFIPGAEILSFKTEDRGDDDDDGSESDEGGWVDVDVDRPVMCVDDSDDDDDENENDKKEDKEKTISTKDAVKEVMKLTAEERAERAFDIVSSRFLTDQDFAKIAAVQAAKYVEKFSLSKKNKNAKRKLDIIEEKTEGGELVPLKNIEMIYKKRKHDRESRLGTVLAGREGREKFGKGKGKMNPHASTSNNEKKRSKNFMMMKHKVKGKQKKSFREKQMKLRKSLLKQQKFKG